MELLFALIGLVIVIFCGSGIWWLVSIILKGISVGNLVTVVGGGVLAYLFLGLLIVGLIAGLAMFFGGIFE